MAVLELRYSSIDSQVSPWLVPIIYGLAKWIVLPFYFLDIQITGQEYIPRNGAVIIAPTHRSRWDAILVPYAVGKLASGRHPRFMVTSTEMKGLQGWFIRHLGGFPVDVDHPEFTSLEHSIGLLAASEMLVIFPEGGIFRDRHIQPLKRGVARIALEVFSKYPNSQIKILPVAVQYDQSFPQKGSKVAIDIAQPLDVSQYQDTSTRQASVQLTQDLSKTLAFRREKPDAVFDP